MNYRLDLRTLLLMLGQSTGNLDAELAHMQGMRGRAHAHLYVESGRVRDCSITDTNGVVQQSGKAALELVYDLVLEWQYTEVFDTLPMSRPKEISPVKTPAPAVQIPRRTSQGTPQDFNTWPRLYRNVYSLVNGVSSIEQIVGTMARGQEPGSILEVLVRLQQAGLITIEER